MAPGKLNCDDLPEASVWPRKNRTSKLHGKYVGLPVVSEMPGESGDEFLADEPLRTSKLWQCEACTLLNHDNRSFCEACNGPKSRTCSDSQEKQGNNSADLLSSMPSLDWPALPTKQFPEEESVESWIDCEVSSVASSWIDVGDMDEHLDNIDSGTVNVTATTDDSLAKKTPSWSAIIGKSRGAGGKMAVMSPPAFRQPLARKCPKVVEVEDQDVLLNELETRRMNGNGKCCRGKSGRKMRR